MIILVGNATRDLDSDYLILINSVLNEENSTDIARENNIRWRLGKNRQWIELWFDNREEERPHDTTSIYASNAPSARVS